MKWTPNASIKAIGVHFVRESIQSFFAHKQNTRLKSNRSRIYNTAWLILSWFSRLRRTTNSRTHKRFFKQRWENNITIKLFRWIFFPFAWYLAFVHIPSLLSEWHGFVCKLLAMHRRSNWNIYIYAVDCVVFMCMCVNGKIYMSKQKTYIKSLREKSYKPNST